LILFNLVQRIQGVEFIPTRLASGIVPTALQTSLRLFSASVINSNKIILLLFRNSAGL